MQKLGQGEDRKYYGEKVGSGGYVCLYKRMWENPHIVYRISGYPPHRPLPQSSSLSIRAAGDSSTSASLDSHLFQAVYTTPNSFSGSFYVSGKLPTYPSPKPTFCPK